MQLRISISLNSYNIVTTVTSMLALGSRDSLKLHPPYSSPNRQPGPAQSSSNLSKTWWSQYAFTVPISHEFPISGESNPENLALIPNQQWIETRKSRAISGRCVIFFVEFKRASEAAIMGKNRWRSLQVWAPKCQTECVND
mmetsp:Transcript_19198/g.31969  ORF Transcript_19198/g.31969 Transcript_19198/m.31969 type:complete len:141 (-) Transcript_19198:3-425(-)